MVHLDDVDPAFVELGGDAAARQAGPEPRSGGRRQYQRTSSRTSTLASKCVSILPPHGVVRSCGHGTSGWAGIAAGPAAPALRPPTSRCSPACHGMLDVALGDEVDAIDQVSNDRPRRCPALTAMPRPAYRRRSHHCRPHHILHRWIKLGSTPITVIPAWALAAVDTPEIRPPPPIGMTRCRDRAHPPAFPARPFPPRPSR